MLMMFTSAFCNGCVCFRALDVLSEDVLVELSAAYRRMVSFLPHTLRNTKHTHKKLGHICLSFCLYYC